MGVHPDKFVDSFQDIYIYMQLGRICVRVGIEETEVRGGKKKRKKEKRETDREGGRKGGKAKQKRHSVREGSDFHYVLYSAALT